MTTATAITLSARWRLGTLIGTASGGRGSLAAGGEMGGPASSDVMVMVLSEIWPELQFERFCRNTASQWRKKMVLNPPNAICVLLHTLGSACTSRSEENPNSRKR